MKKLSYDQVWEKVRKSYEKSRIIDDIGCFLDDDKLISWPKELTRAIVDSFNENIEDHNNKNYICNECDGYLEHSGEQKTSYPPIDIYKCTDCGKIVEFKQRSTIVKDEGVYNAGGKTNKINPNYD